jgi:hypothetical protein
MKTMRETAKTRNLGDKIINPNGKTRHPGEKTCNPGDKTCDLGDETCNSGNKKRKLRVLPLIAAAALTVSFITSAGLTGASMIVPYFAADAEDAAVSLLAAIDSGDAAASSTAAADPGNPAVSPAAPINADTPAASFRSAFYANGAYEASSGTTDVNDTFLPPYVTIDLDGASSPSRVIVAVIDSGIDADNLALDYTKILEAKSYVEGESSCNDRIGHGTAIVGIIQQYAPDAEILPLMYQTRYISGVPRNGGVPAICRAIYDAVDMYGCKIINISSGIFAENDELKEAMEYAESKGVIVISAVGNDNKRVPDRVYYPAAYETVIGVGAVDYEKTAAGFSQKNSSVTAAMYGVGVKAPGIRNSERYVTVSGTSYAAAALCGITAAVVQEYPDITPVQYRELLEVSCEDLGEPGYDFSYGYGMPDVETLRANLRKLAGCCISNPEG